MNLPNDPGAQALNPVDAMPDWFTSDLHFGHKNIVKYRMPTTYIGVPGGSKPAWTTIDEMDEYLIRKWNECVKPGESILVVGDFCLCGTTRAEAVFKRLNGRKFLLRGNHDMKRKPDRWIKMGWDWVGDGQIDYPEFSACHYPYRGDHTHEDRFPDRRPADLGKVLIHGHVHDKWGARPRMINIGVDVRNFRPVRREVVLQLVAEHI